MVGSQRTTRNGSDRTQLDPSLQAGIGSLPVSTSAPVEPESVENESEEKLPPLNDVVKRVKKGRPEAGLLNSAPNGPTVPRIEDARAPPVASNSKDAPKPDTDPLRSSKIRYYDKSVKTGPDYSFSDAAIPAPTVLRGEDGDMVGSNFRPMNTLSRNTSSTIISPTGLDRVGQGSNAERQPKRRKTGNGSFCGTSVQSIDLAESGKKHSFSSEEHKNVERWMKIPHPKGHHRSSGGKRTPNPQPAPLLGVVHLPTKADKATLEDPDDRIVDEEMRIAPSAATEPRVIIAGYKGSANRVPARPVDEKSKVLPYSRKSTGTTSMHFSHPGPRHESVSSESHDELGSPPRSNGGRTKKILSRAATGAQDAGSPDELAHENNDLMEDLDRKLDRTADADDETTSGIDARGNISATKFSRKRKEKQSGSGNTQSRKSFQLWRMFSASQYLLDPENTLHQDFHIRLDYASETIQVVEEKDEIEELAMKLKTIKKSEYSPSGSKIILHKSVDNKSKASAGAAPKVFLEFCTQAAAKEFIETMRHASAANGLKIEFPCGEPAHIDRTFMNVYENMRKISRYPNNTKPQDQPAADDIDFIAKKQKRRATLAKGTIFGNHEVSDLDKPAKKKPRVRDRMEGISGEESEAVSPAQSNSPRALRSARSRYNEEEQRFDLTTAAEGSRSRAQRRQATPRARTPSPMRWTDANPGWADEWHDSINQPQVGKHRANVDKQDIRRLDEGEFLNDNLIQFYLLTLQDELMKRNPVFAQQIYFFNTFFYQNLTKRPSKGAQKGINFEAVHRWTAKIDLFAYRYIVVPVNENTHWYLAIICNPGKLLDCKPTIAPLPLSVDQHASQTVPEQTRSFEVASSPKSSSNTSEVEATTAVNNLSLNDNLMAIAKAQNGPAEPPSSSRDRLLRPFDGSEDITPSPPPSNVPLDNPPEVIKVTTSAIVQSGLAKSEVTRTTPKIRKAPGIKYDVNEPVIITLDSLGATHYPTCNNLREYLIAELQEKRHFAFASKKDVGGLCAKGIPEQTNHCDCGLFLLLYVEAFLEAPEAFAGKLLQREPLGIEWKSASSLREHIRSKLFDWQKKLYPDGRPANRGKSKPSRNLVDLKLASATTLEAREDLKSTRSSPSQSCLQGERTATSTADDGYSHDAQILHNNGEEDNSLSEVPISREASKSTRVPTASEETRLLEADTNHTPTAHESRSKTQTSNSEEASNIEPSGRLINSELHPDSERASGDALIASKAVAVPSRQGRRVAMPKLAEPNGKKIIPVIDLDDNSQDLPRKTDSVKSRQYTTHNIGDQAGSRKSLEQTLSSTDEVIFTKEKHGVGAVPRHAVQGTHAASLAEHNDTNRRPDQSVGLSRGSEVAPDNDVQEIQLYAEKPRDQKQSSGLTTKIKKIAKGLWGLEDKSQLQTAASQPSELLNSRAHPMQISGSPEAQQNGSNQRDRKPERRLGNPLGSANLISPRPRTSISIGIKPSGVATISADGNRASASTSTAENKRRRETLQDVDGEVSMVPYGSKYIDLDEDEDAEMLLGIEEAFPDEPTHFLDVELLGSSPGVPVQSDARAVGGSGKTSKPHDPFQDGLVTELTASSRLNKGKLNGSREQGASAQRIHKRFDH